MSEGKGVKFLRFLAEHGLLITLGLGLLVRIYLLFVREYVIVNDGILYVAWIEKIEELGMKGAFTKAYPFNLFPLLAALVHKLAMGFLSIEGSVLAINFVCGLLALIPPYLLARRIFGKMPALVTGFYVAWHPIFTEISCQVLREASAICLGMWAVYFLICGLEKEDSSEWDYKKLIAGAVLAFMALTIRLEMLALLVAGFFALFFSHCGKGRNNHFAKRLTIFLFCVVFLLVSAAAVFGAVRYVKGQWDFARLDKMMSPQALGEEKYSVEDPLKPSAEIYDAQGKPIPMARTKYAFAHLAWDHQRALFGYEILYKTWKTLHPVGLALFLIALYFLIVKKPIKYTSPINVFSLALVIIMGAIFYRYVSTKFAVSNRHIVLPVFVLSVYMGLFTRYLRVEKPIYKLALAFCLAAAFVMLTYKAFRPLESHRLPLKRYGEQLAPSLPKNAMLLEPDGLKQIAYYAGAKHKMWASQTADDLLYQLTPRFLVNFQDESQTSSFLPVSDCLKQTAYFAKIKPSQIVNGDLGRPVKNENVFLLVNFKDEGHTASFLPISDRLEHVLSLSPENNKFDLKLYRLKK